MPNEPALYAIVVALALFFFTMWVKSVRDEMKKLRDTYVSDTCCKERRTTDEEKCKSIAKNIEESVSRVQDDLDRHVHSGDKVQYRR